MKRIIFLITIWTGICLSGIGQISKSVIAKQSNLQITKAGEYDKISLDNVYYMDIVGQPELPVYVQSFVVPIDAQINGITIIVTTEEINANYQGSDLTEKIRNYL